MSSIYDSQRKIHGERWDREAATFRKFADYLSREEIECIKLYSPIEAYHREEWLGLSYQELVDRIAEEHELAIESWCGHEKVKIYATLSDEWQRKHKDLCAMMTSEWKSDLERLRKCDVYIPRYEGKKDD